MNTLRYIFLFCVVMLTPAFVINARTNITAINSTQRKQLIDDAWQFTLVQNDKGEQVPTSFQMVDLPHDWSILNDFTEGAAMGNDGGYLPAGKGLYKKTLVATYDDIAKGRHLLYLEGAYMDAHVFVNDSLVGYRPYGYSSVLYDLSSNIKCIDNQYITFIKVQIICKCMHKTTYTKYKGTLFIMTSLYFYASRVNILL